MRFFPKILFFISLLLLFTKALYAAEWYESYENAKKAIDKQRWEQALNLLNSALGVKSKPSANAKTYGLRFIDYFPYLYRGIANYHLGDFVAAEVDLKKSKSFGQVGKSRRDKTAKKKLETYLNLLAALNKSEPEINLVKTTFNEAVDLFNQKNFEAAEKKFEAVLKQDSNHSGAQIYLQKIEGEFAKVADLKTKQSEPPKKKPGTKKKSEQVARLGSPKSNLPEGSKKGTGSIVLDLSFQEGLALFEAGDLTAAKLKFSRVNKTATNYLETTEYLQKINTAEKQAREGVTFFFEGNNTQSIKLLSEALIVYRTNLNVQVCLGSAYATEYFLSGEENKESLQKALTEFDNVKKLDSSYRLDSRFFSPRILELFAQADQN